MRKLPVIPLILTLALLAGNAAHAASHFTAPAASPTIMHIAGNLTIDGAGARVNDEVGVFDSGGVLVGSFAVTDAGLYGDLVINGDDAATPGLREGASAGEALSLKVWSAAKQREYSGSEIGLVETNVAGIYLAPVLQLGFASGSFSGLNIAATAAP